MNAPRLWYVTATRPSGAWRTYTVRADDARAARDIAALFADPECLLTIVPYTGQDGQP